MDIKDLGKKIKVYKEETEKKLREEEAKEREQEEINKQFWEKEQKLLPKKKRIFKEITEWKGEFAKTEQFKAIASSYRLANYTNEIVIYRGNWGHANPRFGGHGCWSEINLNLKSGELRYYAGYKWMPSGPSIKINENTLDKIICAYLQDFHKEIKSGEVYERIAKQLEKPVL
ncbi:hypothetical protein HY643_05365 [Candidatus Woesearchaeota archaeon]|nr:hypothetical protein [Candidatus Woesearchaeota archaeon]